MGAPARRDVDCYRGDTYEHVITFVEDDEVTPMDLSAYSFSASLREAPDDDLILSFTVDQTDADVGIVVVSIDAVDTSTLVRSAYFYDIQTTTGSVTETLLRGKFTVTKDVTQLGD